MKYVQDYNDKICALNYSEINSLAFQPDVDSTYYSFRYCT